MFHVISIVAVLAPIVLWFPSPSSTPCVCSPTLRYSSLRRPPPSLLSHSEDSPFAPSAQLVSSFVPPLLSRRIHSSTLLPPLRSQSCSLRSLSRSSVILSSLCLFHRGFQGRGIIHLKEKVAKKKDSYSHLRETSREKIYCSYKLYEFLLLFLGATRLEVRHTTYTSKNNIIISYNSIKQTWF